MNVEANVGNTDRNIRLIAGVVLLVLFFFVSGPLQWVAGVAGLIMLVTGAMRFCPIYTILGRNTLPKA